MLNGISKYHGEFFNFDLRKHRVISNWIAQDNRALRVFYIIMNNQQIYAEYITLMSTRLYGVETWSTTRRETRVEAEKMKLLRVMAGKIRKDKVKQETVRVTAGLKPKYTTSKGPRHLRYDIENNDEEMKENARTKRKI